MTRQTFYRALRKAVEERAVRVRVEHSGRISLFAQAQKAPYCPITFVCWHRTGRELPLMDYDEAAYAIGLNDPEAIVAAADSARGEFGGFDPRIRRSLLRAVGVPVQ